MLDLIFFALIFFVVGVLFAIYIAVKGIVKKRKKLLLSGISILGLFIFPPVILLSIAEIAEKMRIRIDFLPEIGNEPEIVELRRSDCSDGRYSERVLIKNPPENTDSLKKIMARYFLELSSYQDAVEPGSYVEYVCFYKYTPKTAYFIRNDEDHSERSPNTLDMNYDAYIGSILSRQPCGGDSTKYIDVMNVRNKSGYLKPDTLRWECDGILIDNWGKYK